MTTRINAGVIGAGHWGPNIIRLLMDHPDVNLEIVCELSEARAKTISDKYRVKTTPDYLTIVNDPHIDMVIICTPASTHYEIASKALEQKKHVFVEKPITVDLDQACKLKELAEKQQVVLMVGHIFLYNQAYSYLKKQVLADDFGKMLYVYSRRLNLGPVRNDVHAGWDLATHDISMILDLKQSLPYAVTASSHCIINSQIADIMFATLYFADGTCGHIHASWLDPQKIREFVVVGENKMIIFDDMNIMEPIRICNKSFKRSSNNPGEKVVDSIGSFRIELNNGDITIPSISTGQPLTIEIQDLIDSVKEMKSPLSDAKIGVDVVNVMNAIDESIKKQSIIINIK